MVRLDDHTISLGTLLAVLALLGTGIGAWVDVKGDVATTTEKAKNNEKNDQEIKNRLERMEEKLDRIIERQLED